jgi:transposase
MKKIRRISQVNPKLCNRTKQIRLHDPFDQYTIELQKLVDLWLYQDNIPKLLGQDITKDIDLTARLSQVVAKHASSIVRSIQEKVKIANKTEIKEKYQVELLEKYNNNKLKIDIKSINIELDSRFIDIQQNKTSKICDYWIKIISFPIKSYYIPIKFTNHMKDLIKRGYKLKTNSARINSNGSIGIYFEKDQLISTTYNNSIGIDTGRNKLVSCSNRAVETTHMVGRKTKQILELIKRRKSNSNQSKKTRTQLIQQINYCLKHDINWTNLDKVIIENLSSIKQGNKWGKSNHHWLVGFTHNRIKQLSEENGVRLTQVNAAYTSQTCCMCGNRDKNNRKKELFLCLFCGCSSDADYNASVNIHDRGMYSSSALKTHYNDYRVSKLLG